MPNRARSKMKPLTSIKCRKFCPVSGCEHTNVDPELSWTPDFFGPVFKNDKISLREALQTHLIDKRTRIMASFVPDELIYALDLTMKNFREFVAVLLLVDMSAFNSAWTKYNCAENNGSHGFSSILNIYMRLIVADIYSSEGDIIHISAEEVLVMWKVRKDELIAKTIDTVLGRALNMKNVIADLSVIAAKFLRKVKMAISSGLVIFSVIGNENGRSVVLVGNPVVEVQKAKDTCSPGDVIVTESAWEHVSPQNYEYVLRYAHGVKVVRPLGPWLKSYGTSGTSISYANENVSSTFQRFSTLHRDISDGELPTSLRKNKTMYKLPLRMEELQSEKRIFTGRFSMVEATRRKLGTHLRSFTINLVLQQIEKDFPLEHLRETGNVTVVVMDLHFLTSSVYELLTLIDECYILLNRVISNRAGCFNALTIRDKAIHFVMVFGLIPNTHDHCKNGILCAAEGIERLKYIGPGFRKISVGISTGMAHCGVIGHNERMNYVTFGPPIEKANKIALISSGKIYCDVDTILYSCLPREQFRFRGMKDLKGFGRCHLYQFIYDLSIQGEPKNMANLDYVYPILGRYQELDIFTDILDDICVADRTYCGFLIEGPERIGKSRLLDEFARIVESREITGSKVCLDESYAAKPYATIYQLLMQLVDAEGSRTIEEREKALVRKLCTVVDWDDLCYMNIVSRVAFPLSTNYHSESEEVRLSKSLKVFDAILQSLKKPQCIMLDDVQFMDIMSWRYISRAMNSKRVVLSMSMRTPVSPTDFPESHTFITSDKRIFRHQLHGMEPDHLSALVCQLLSVQAIPRKLDNILRSRSDNHPGWCEAFITLMLQNESLRLSPVTPEEGSRADLVHPHPSLITKILKDLSPDDTTPEVPWLRGETHSMVCLISDQFTGDVDAFLSIGELRREIYSRSSPFERNLLQLATILGNVFTRSALENSIVDLGRVDTTRGEFMSTIVNQDSDTFKTNFERI